jgi:hypothetical protein
MCCSNWGRESGNKIFSKKQKHAANRAEIEVPLIIIRNIGVTGKRRYTRGGVRSLIGE